MELKMIETSSACSVLKGGPFRMYQVLSTDNPKSTRTVNSASSITQETRWEVIGFEYHIVVACPLSIT